MWSQEPCVPLWHVFPVPVGELRENYHHRKHSTPDFIQLCIKSRIMSRPGWLEKTSSLWAEKQHDVNNTSSYIYRMFYFQSFHTFSQIAFQIQTRFYIDTLDCLLYTNEHFYIQYTPTQMCKLLEWISATKNAYNLHRTETHAPLPLHHKCKLQILFLGQTFVSQNSYLQVDLAMRCVVIRLEM